jgi:uncharacterized protein YndB with AHSA1/START domain
VNSHPEGDRWILVFVRDLAHPPARVWKALTDPSELALWSPFDADRDLASVGPATLTMVDGATRVPLAAEIQVADAPAVLQYGWGDDLLRWELEPTPDGTRLTLRHTTDGREMLSKAAAGWHMCFAVAEAEMAGRPFGRIVGSAALDYGWQQLDAAYAKVLGL